jgi:predicted ferric reductase
MLEGNNQLNTQTSSGTKDKVTVVACTVLLLFGTLVIPFAYETQTLWYKSGVKKVLLIAGQMSGLLAMFFLLLQIVLAIRPKLLTALFGASQIVRWHKVNGGFIALAAFVHVLLVLLPEGIDNLPIGKKYWPEMTGMLVLLFVFLTVSVSYLRNRLRLTYSSWRVWHTILGYLIPLVACIHVLFVSESFHDGAPRVSLLIVITGLFLLIVTTKIVARNTKKRN